MDDLFRREALTHATRRLTGVVVLRSSRTTWWITGILIAAVASGAAFAATATYARKETVSGWLIPPAGLIRQSARQGGVVQAFHVQEGQEVRAGQAIATIRLSASTASGDSYTVLERTFGAQASASQERAEAALQALRAEQISLEREMAALGRERTEARRRVTLQRERLRLAQAELARVEPIAARGFLTGRELESRRSAALQADQTLSEMSGQVLALDRQIAEAEARLWAIPISLRTAKADAIAAQAGITQERTQAETSATYVVTASITGRVVALPASLGQSLDPNGIVAVVGPSDAPLEAELYVPSRAAGFVRRGQDVRLMYQAFPFQKFGASEGQVISVSRTVLAPTEVQLPGSQINEPVFRVRARLAKAEVSAYGEAVPLQPGMMLNADIILDRRNLYEWLLDPLYAAGRRG